MSLPRRIGTVMALMVIIAFVLSPDGWMWLVKNRSSLLEGLLVAGGLAGLGKQWQTLTVSPPRQGISWALVGWGTPLLLVGGFFYVRGLLTNDMPFDLFVGGVVTYVGLFMVAMGLLRGLKRGDNPQAPPEESNTGGAGR